MRTIADSREMFTGAGPAPIGTWLKMDAAEPVEIMAHAGFDFVVVDLEHAPLDLHTAYRLINSASALGMTPLVRVPDKNPSTIQKILDAGAHGILVPHVDTVDEAVAVGQACRFPPAGTRGAGGTSRAGLWGTRHTQDYLLQGEQVLCIPQLEAPEATALAEKIASQDVVDAIFVGTADLAMAMGTAPGDSTTQQQVNSALAAAQRCGKPLGLAFAAVEPAVAAVETGCNFVVVDNDTSMLASAARATVRQFREPLQQ